MIIKIGENTYTQSDIQELRTSICKLENEISECDNTIESKISKEELKAAKAKKKQLLKALKELKKAERRLAIVSDKFKEKPFESYYDDKEVEKIIKKQADKLVDEEVEKNRKEKSYNQFIDMIDDKK